MFDVIGKRRWFYLISLAFTIPGLFFILLTPFTGRGPAVHHRLHRRDEVGDPLRGPERHARPGRGGVRQQGLEATAVTTGSGFIEIKTVQPADFLEVVPSAAPQHERLAGRQLPARAPAAAPRPAAERAHRQRQPIRDPERVTGSVRRRPPPRRAPRPSPPPATGNTEIPTQGTLGEVAAALQEELGPIAEQRSLTTIGAVVSSDLITPGARSSSSSARSGSCSGSPTGSGTSSSG